MLRYVQSMLSIYMLYFILISDSKTQLRYASILTNENLSESAVN